MLLASSGRAGAESLDDANDAFLRGDYAAALRIWRPLAEQGDVKAEAWLGNSYLSGFGVPHDSAKAMKWLREAAHQGDSQGERGLGFLYLFGDGVRRDYSQALDWFHKAVDQGDVPAQAALGTMYESGNGVPQDYVQAHMWFNLAAAGGFEPARKYRDALAARMPPDQIAEAQHLAREWRPMKVAAGSHHVTRNQAKAGCSYVDGQLACPGPGTGLCWAKGHNPWLDQPPLSIDVGNRGSPDYDHPERCG
jgi:TPR repeat protein